MFKFLNRLSLFYEKKAPQCGASFFLSAINYLAAGASVAAGAAVESATTAVESATGSTTSTVSSTTTAVESAAGVSRKTTYSRKSRKTWTRNSLYCRF